MFNKKGLGLLLCPGVLYWEKDSTVKIVYHSLKLLPPYFVCFTSCILCCLFMLFYVKFYDKNILDELVGLSRSLI